jgi:hypothetical protein
MSSPRDPGRDLRLERLGDRGHLRPAHLGEAAAVAPHLAGASGAWELRAAYEALIDAVFTAPGAAEWLLGLRRAVAARLAREGAAPRDPAARDAIRAADHAPPTQLPAPGPTGPCQGPPGGSGIRKPGA